ncbi:MAG TPA: PRC-barrel domain-containing protein [Stellaceae bacterium]|nr:PRC-barrel domain-containing protein [Stellaceae bacterium]
MATIRTGALVSALLIAAAPAAFAATHTAPVQTPPKTIAGTIQPNQMRASKLIGMDVYGMYNVKIGSVQDVILNRNGTVAAVVFSANGKNVALPLDDFNGSHNRLTLTHLTQQQLKEAGQYNLTNKNTGAGTTGSPLHGGQLGVVSAAGAGSAGTLAGTNTGLHPQPAPNNNNNNNASVNNSGSTGPTSGKLVGPGNAGNVSTRSGLGEPLGSHSNAGR